MSQNFADKNVYLVDSLDLSKISDYDKAIVDSCIELYHQSKDEETKFKAIDHLINECWGEDVWPKYNDWLHQISNQKLKGKISLKQKKLYKSLLSTAYNNKGYLADQQGKSDWALKYYNKSFDIDEELNDQEGMAQILNNMGGVFLKQGKIEEAIAAFGESLKIREKENDSLGISQSLANIGTIYMNQGENDKSLEYLFRCITYVKEDNYSRLGLFYNNIGTIYSERNEVSKAFEYYNKSLEMEKTIGNIRGSSQVLNNLGVLIKNSNIIECDLQEEECDKIKSEKALEYYLESLAGYEQIEDKGGAAFTMNNIGSSYSQLGNMKLAEEYLIKSLKISKIAGYPNPLKDAAVHLSDLYFKQGKIKESLEMYKLHIKMRDSLTNESTQKAAIQQQAKYEYEKQKAVDDAEHDKEIAIEQEAKEKQTILTYATAGGLGLVGIFLLVVFNRLKVTRRQKSIIEEQKTEVEKQKSVVELAHTELEEKNREITDSIQYAKRIQNAILP
ncbi:MAG: tetratricopeptide repeat protein, partial [Vicingaceae bacterium]|nr:tetratricopeptide repeat protein [Vicingaceae bacterium]